jgi:hypothetical protein
MNIEAIVGELNEEETLELAMGIFSDYLTEEKKYEFLEAAVDTPMKVAVASEWIDLEEEEEE